MQGPAARPKYASQIPGFPWARPRMVVLKTRFPESGPGLPRASTALYITISAMSNSRVLVCFFSFLYIFPL
jgi:hypothetical protein